MVVVITYIDPKDRVVKVSHGVDMDTLKGVVLPAGTPISEMPVQFDRTLGEYVLVERSGTSKS